MKKILLILILFSTFLCYAEPAIDVQAVSSRVSNQRIEDHIRTNTPLLQLLKLLGMEPITPDGNSLEQINQWAQSNLLRKGERWEKQSNKFEGLKPKILPLLKELGFVDSKKPLYNEYQGAIVYGALLPRVRLRINYLVEQWKQGIRFTHLYFLGGERPLEAQLENMESYSITPKTECEMMRCVWEEAIVPQKMREQVQVHFINAPMRNDLRPTTEDTVVEWLKHSPPHGRYLGITNNPYINRQDLVIRRMAPAGYEFDTVGPGIVEHEKIALILDELARAIYTKSKSCWGQLSL